MRSDDEKLVSQTLSGGRDAFGVLVHKYQEMVYAYAFQGVDLYHHLPRYSSG